MRNDPIGWPPASRLHVFLELCFVLLLVQASSAQSTQPDTISRAAKGGSGGPVLPPPRYITDRAPDRVKTLLFTSISPEYLADRADFFARNRVDGVMMGSIMDGWESDVWKQPTPNTPEARSGRVVGAENPLFVMCKRTNERCRAAGIRYNSVKVAFSRPLPDWFEDAAWAATAENFRQGAIFARDAGFAGIALDAEYVADQYKLSYPAYQAADYPRDRLRKEVLKRGRQIVSAMLDEYPHMVFWLLPEIASAEDWLANDLFAGMMLAMAERDAPGGFHLCKEETYLQTRPRSIMWCVDRTNQAVAYALGGAADTRVASYWHRRGTVAVGLWPLGYYREVYDQNGKLLGYTGKYEKFHDQLVGSAADKSENYSAEEFRRSFAAARLLSRSFVWIYCHGQVLWHMTPEEIKHYHAGESDALPVVSNLDDYLSVMRQRSTLEDPTFLQAALQVRDQKPLPHVQGSVPRWWIAGPFPHNPERFDESYPPETNIDLQAQYGPFTFPGQSKATAPVRWKTAAPDPSGYIDLKALLGKPGTPVAYGAAWVELEQPRQVLLHIGSNDFAAVFVNGRRVYRSAEPRPAVPDDDRVPLELPAGRSQILMKCADAGGKDWGFFLHITDDEGSAVSGLRWLGPN